MPTFHTVETFPSPLGSLTIIRKTENRKITYLVKNENSFILTEGSIDWCFGYASGHTQALIAAKLRNVETGTHVA